MMLPTPSALYRLSQVLRVLAILALVLLLLFLATVTFSAVQLGRGVAKQAGTLHRSTAATMMGNDILVNVTFPISNQGYYDIHDLTLVSVFTDQTILPGPLAVSTAGPANIPGYGQGNLSLRTAFDMASPAGPFLLVNDAQVQGNLWLNASYAVVLPVHLAASFVYHWGAPFANLSYLLGAPGPEPNGTVALPVTIQFEDHTPGLTLNGTLSVAVRDPNGTLCTEQAFPIASRDGPVTLLKTFYAPDTCSLSGDSVTSVFSSPGPPLFSVELPTEALP